MHSQTYLLTLFLGLLLLLFTVLAPARAEVSTAVCLLKEFVTDTNFEPRSSDVSLALTKFWVDCTGTRGTPHLPSSAVECQELVNIDTANIRLCPPTRKDPAVWKAGERVHYTCMEVRKAIMDIMAYCNDRGRTAGSVMLENKKKGMVVVKRVR